MEKDDSLLWSEWNDFFRDNGALLLQLARVYAKTELGKAPRDTSDSFTVLPFAGNETVIITIQRGTL